MGYSGKRGWKISEEILKKLGTKLAYLKISDKVFLVMTTLHLNSKDYSTLAHVLTVAALRCRSTAFQAERDANEAERESEKAIHWGIAHSNLAEYDAIEEFANKVGVRFSWQTQVVSGKD